MRVGRRLGPSHRRLRKGFRSSSGWHKIGFELPMNRWVYLVAVALVWTALDVPKSYDRRQPGPGPSPLMPLSGARDSQFGLPNVFVAVAQATTDNQKNVALTANSRLDIVRYV